MSEETKQKPTQIKLSDTVEELTVEEKTKKKRTKASPEKIKSDISEPLKEKVEKSSVEEKDSKNAEEQTVGKNAELTNAETDISADIAKESVDDAPIKESEGTDGEKAELTEGENGVSEADVEIPEESESTLTDEKEDERFINVEHFSDYKSKAERLIEERAADFLPEGVTFENLTIFDDCLIEDIEEENPKLEQSVPSPDKTEDADSKKYDPKHPRKIDGRFELVELFVFTLLAVMLLTTFVFRYSVVSGHSMENTLHHGEVLLTTNLFYEPEVGDIIVFEDYSTGYHKPVVKRVIATAGQTVRITPNAVYVDEVMLSNEYYVYIDDESFNYYAESQHLLTKYKNGAVIPEGEIFVMGDHRNNSTDSRVFDSISEDAVLGRVITRVYPFDKFGKVE